MNKIIKIILFLAFGFSITPVALLANENFTLFMGDNLYLVTGAMGFISVLIGLFKPAKLGYKENLEVLEEDWDEE